MNDYNELPVLDVPLFFGRFLVTTGIISEQDLESILTVQKDLSDCLMCAALERGLIVLKDFVECRAYQREKLATTEEALLHIGKLADADIVRLKTFMADVHVRIGEILVIRGILTPEKLGKALKDYEKYNSIGSFE